MRHYLFHRDIYIREESAVQEEEAFSLSPLRRAILRKHEHAALNRAKREGDFPIGVFGQLAQQQLQQEIEALPTDLQVATVDLQIGNVHLVGDLEGVCEEGLFAFEKKNLRGAVKMWPLFLVLAAIHPKTHSLLFSRDGKKGDRFFDDPMPYLKKMIAYYFFSQHVLSPLFPDWVEPILRKDPTKLEKAQNYDASLKWALRGQTPLAPDQLIASWKEEADSLYKEMADAWF